MNLGGTEGGNETDLGDYLPVIKKRKNVSIFLLKPTDAFFRELTLCAEHADTADASTKVEFAGDGTSGRFVLNNGKFHTFSIQRTETSCANQEVDVLFDKGQTFEDLGTLAGKVQIAATDDVFDATKQRWSEVEQQAKEKQTKEVKTVSSSKSKQMQRVFKNIHPSNKLPSANAHSSRPLTPIASMHSQVKPKKPLSSQPSLKASSPSTASAPVSEVSKRPLRQRVMQMIVLKPYSRAELMVRLQQEGIVEQDRTSVADVLNSVGVQRGADKWTLDKRFYSEIDQNWPFYSAYDKQMLKRALESHNNVSQEPKSVPPPPSKKTENGTSSAEVLNSSSVPSKHVSQKQKPSENGAAPELKRKQRTEQKTNAAPRSVQGSPVGAVVATKPVPVYESSNKKLSSKSRESSPVREINNGYQKQVQPESTTQFDESGFDSEFPPISSMEQRSRYRELFNQDYDEYIGCYRRLAAVSEHFQELEKKLNACDADSDEGLQVEKTICDDFAKFEKDSDILQAKRRHAFLHAKLETIKRRVSDYDKLVNDTSSDCSELMLGIKMDVQKLEQITSRLERVTVRLENMATGNSVGQKGQDESALPPLIESYNAAISETFTEFISLSRKIGSDLTELAGKIEIAFNRHRDFISAAIGISKPSELDLVKLLQPMSDAIIAIQNFRQAKLKGEFANHLSAVSESIAALGWVQVAPAPSPFIKEMVDAAQFYTNRVLKDYKDKDQTHVQWTKTWLQLLASLQQYVKSHHTTGLQWNANPGYKPSGADKNEPKKTEVRSAVGGPPPPPPPPPPAPLVQPEKPDSTSDLHAALFAEINKGTDITKGLKKVTSDMQTHKNPELKQAGPPPIPSKPAHLQGEVRAVSTKKQPEAVAALPVLKLDGGKKWVVENFKGDKNVIVEVTDMKQVMYIWKCVDSVIQVKGKINSITMDSCKKTSIVFDALVSSLEIINCQSVKVQTLGKMPTLTINKTDGCQVFLSAEALDTEIVSSKSSEMNICLPEKDGALKEIPVPESYKTTLKGNKLETVPVEICG